MAGTDSESLKHFPPSIQNLLHFIIESGVVNKIVLFGSRARGDARENSDYDFAVWVNDRSKWTQVSLDIEEKNLTLLPVDLLVYNEAAVDYQKQIDDEGQLVYCKK